jgi:hypothetical protein
VEHAVVEFLCSLSPFEEHGAKLQHVLDEHLATAVGAEAGTEVAGQGVLLANAIIRWGLKPKEIQRTLVGTEDESQHIARAVILGRIAPNTLNQRQAK